MNKDILMNDIRCEEIPSKDEVIKLLSDLRKFIFPGYFETICENDEEYFNNKLKKIRKKLTSEIEKSYIISKMPQSNILETVEQFLKKLTVIKEYLRTDIQKTLDSDPAAVSVELVILTYPGILAITIHRIAHELYKLNIPFIPRMMSEYAHSITGIDIHPGATIGKYFFIDHGTGIVIGETTVIGEHVKIYQGVTLGALSLSGGSKLQGIKRHPTIKNNVTLYSGVSIFGGETIIGDNVTVGSNVFLTESVLENTKVILKKPELILKTKVEN